MPRKKKEVEEIENLTPDETDLEDDTLSMIEEEVETYELATDEEVAGMTEEVVSGIELQLGVLTARIEELTTIVRKLEKKLEKAAIGDTPAPKREAGFGREGGFGGNREGGFKPREGGFRPREGGSSFRPREGGSRDGGGFRPREGGSRDGGFRPREGGGFGGNRDGGFRPREDSGSREGGFRPREGGGFGGGSRDGGFKPREGGFRPRDDSRGGGSFGGAREGGFRPREDARPSRDDSRGSSSFGGKRRDHGFGKRRDD